MFIFQYGFGFLKFQLLLCRKPEFACDVSPTKTPADGNCLLHGILYLYLYLYIYIYILLAIMDAGRTSG